MPNSTHDQLLRVYSQNSYQVPISHTSKNRTISISYFINYNMSPQNLTLGPVGNQWQYSPSANYYDLSRGSSKKLSIDTTRGTEVKSISIDPEISALIIVDMQNFFLHPKCRDHPLGLKTIEPLLKVIDTCRIEGIQVSLPLLYSGELSNSCFIDHLAELGPDRT